VSDFDVRSVVREESADADAAPSGRTHVPTTRPVLMRLPLTAAQVLVVIPTLNEAHSIAPTIERLRRQGCVDVRVIDNGSTDGTAVAARGADADVIAEPVKGYGMACWRGLQDLPAHTEWILFCDADGCDDIEALPRFIEAANNGAEFVLANRLATKAGRRNLTLPQRFGNQLATKLIRLIWGARFHDLGPMRLIHRALLDEIAMQDRGFGWTVEMQIRVAQLGAPFAEIPVAYHARRHGRSKISGTVRGVVMAGSVILSTIAYHALSRRTEIHSDNNAGDKR
jgi:glycosyltransferase involved in cell wall biosynthesis